MMAKTIDDLSVLHRFYTGLSEACCTLRAVIKVHVAADGTKSFQVYGRARIREKSVRIYVGSFASKKQAEATDEQHRVTQRGIKAGDLPPAVDHKRTMGDGLDAGLRAIKVQRSLDEYESRMR